MSLCTLFFHLFGSLFSIEKVPVLASDGNGFIDEEFSSVGPEQGDPVVGVAKLPKHGTAGIFCLGMRSGSNRIELSSKKLLCDIRISNENETNYSTPSKSHNLNHNDFLKAIYAFANYFSPDLHTSNHNITRSFRYLPHHDKTSICPDHSSATVTPLGRRWLSRVPDLQP